MAATSYDPFFWNDWQGDPCLRACSLAAQGLWMRMLCLAAEAPRKGFVMIGERYATTADIATQAAVPNEVAEALIFELENNAVFSRDRSGHVYSRRMIRDAKRLAASAKGGRKGGRVSRDNKTGIHATPIHTQDVTPLVAPHPMELPLPLPLPEDSSARLKDRAKKTESSGMRTSKNRRAQNGAAPDDIFVLPDWIANDPALKAAWDEVVIARRRHHPPQPSTAKALTLLIERLEELQRDGDDPLAVLKQALRTGHPDFYAIRRDAPGTRRTANDPVILLTAKDKPT
jgi:hypothetical protein